MVRPTIRTVLRLVPFALALAIASCAGPARLARQSDQALARGDVRKAYDRAKRAVEKDPLNAEARSAYAAASTRISADYRGRVRALAAADTLRGADLALEYRDFRSEVALHQFALPSDADFPDQEQRILTAAARRYYRAGRDALAAHRPKDGWRQFRDCRHYVPGFADVEKQLDAAYRQALTTVAVLPFADGIHVPGLSEEMGAKFSLQIAHHAADDLTFTRIVDHSAVEERMTLAELHDLSREAAVALGRRLGADRVVSGRFSGLRSTTDSQDLTLPVYRRVQTKDEQGHSVEHYEEASLRVVTRERVVNVEYEFDVVDVRTGAVLQHRAEPVQTVARVVWTDFQPEGDCDAYTLLPPDVRKADPVREKRVDGQWKERIGEWPLPALLKSAREARERARYASGMRAEFYRDTRRRPVWLGELPGENDMAFVALDDAWRTVLAVLQQLDPED